MSHSPCLSLAQLMRILGNSALPDETAESEDHLDQCLDCRAMLVDLVKTLPDLLREKGGSVLQ